MKTETKPAETHPRIKRVIREPVMAKRHLVRLDTLEPLVLHLAALAALAIQRGRARTSAISAKRRGRCCRGAR